MLLSDGHDDDGYDYDDDVVVTIVFDYCVHVFINYYYDDDDSYFYYIMTRNIIDFIR